MKKESHNEEIQRLCEKGGEGLQSAQANLKQNFLDTAVSRAYYSMFYYAQALLLTKDLRYSRHTGVISALGEHFVKTGLLDAGIHKLLMDAFELRATGDYDYMTKVSLNETQRVVKDAATFIQAIRSLLPPA